MKKRMLSALLTMCVMLTMLPLSALAADETEDKTVETETLELVAGSEYKLFADTTVAKVVSANSGDYALNLDTYALKANGFSVGGEASLALNAAEGNDKGVYANGDDTIKFTLDGPAAVGKNVIFNDAVLMTKSAPKSRAVEINEFSGTYKDDLTIGSNVMATLKDATLDGKLVIGKDAVLTINGEVTAAKEVEVSGKLIVESDIKGAGKLVMKDGGEVEVKNADSTPYGFKVNGSGVVGVYSIDADNQYKLLADVTATSILPMPNNGEISLQFSREVDKLTIADQVVTDDIDKDSNTYLFHTDTETRTIVVDFARSSGGGGGGGSGSNITIASATHGSVSVSPRSAAKGDTVTVAVKPDKGYVLDALTVTDKDGKKLDLTDKGDDKYTFVMPSGSVTVKAAFKTAPKTPFTDVADSAWYADAVAYVYEKGMVKGTGETEFSPEETTTRAMIVAILYRLEGEPTASAANFSDVGANKYYAKAVAWAASNKIVTGYGNGRFGPNDIITREQMSAILYRYASHKGYDVSEKADLSAYTDASQIGVFAKDSMQWANAAGLITGTTSTELAPKSGATRAEVATIMMRFCENIAK